MSEALVRYALKYEKFGCFVLPINPQTKQPYVKWAYRKKEQPTPDELDQWWGIWKNANIGIATGALSGIDVVDLDGPEAKERFEAMVGSMPETIMQITGRNDGGLHLWFKHNGCGLRNIVGKGDNKGIDFKTTGGFVVAAPSVHKSGKIYQFANIDPLEHGLDDLLEMPPEIIEHFKTQNGNFKNRKSVSLDPVGQGSRNDTLTRLVGKWISQGSDYQTVLLTAMGWYYSLPDKTDFKAEEVERTVESVFRTHERNYPDETAKERLAIQEESSMAEESRPSKKVSDNLIFPETAMVGAGGQFARLYSDHLEPPVHFFFMSFLTCLGSILSNRITLKTEIKPQPRLYTLLLGESADDRKSTAIDKTVDFFKNTIEGFSVCFGIGSAEGLQRKLKEAPETLLFLDEFKHFVGKCKIQNSVLLPCVNTFFESNRYESWTAKKEIFIPDGALSILAACTLQTYESVWDQSFTDIGFNNRLFLVPGSGKREYSLPGKVPDHKVQWLKEELQKVLHHANYHQEIDFTDEAKEQYHRWYLNMPQSIHCKRLDVYALRIMTLLAVNECKEIIDTDIITKTIAVCDWQLEARQLHDPVDADNEYAKMEERIRRVLHRGPRTDRELRQYCNVKKSGLWIFNSAKSNLEKADEIGRDKKTRKWATT